MKLSSRCLRVLFIILLVLGRLSAVQAQVVAWGAATSGQSSVPAGLSGVVAIAAGGYHSLALKPDGSVVAWGSNASGQIAKPPNLSDVVAIAAGTSHSLALRADGTVAAWGAYDYGQSFVPAGLNGVVAIAAGGSHSLALKTEGAVVAWGSNTAGQREVPPGLSGVVAIAAGNAHSMALGADGSVVAWGSNASGQSTVPSGLSGVVAIAAGYNFSLALKVDGTVVAWGANDYGQRTVPAGLSGVVTISAGGWNALAVKADGSVVTWGYNAYGQGTVPSGSGKLIAVAGGLYHSLAIKGPTGPPLITCARRWITEAAGTRAGNVQFYQRAFASGSPTSYTATGLPAGLVLNQSTGIISGAATVTGTFPITLSASNSNGTSSANIVLTVTGLPRLGQPLPSIVQNPRVQIFAVGTISLTGLPGGATFDSATGVIAGLPLGVHVMSVTVSTPYGTVTIPWTAEVPVVFDWGYDDPGQTKMPAGVNDIVAISRGTSHSIALQANGSVIFWGDNTYGQGNLPAGLSSVVAIAAGSIHSLALVSDGSVVAWGDNYNQQSTVPAGLSGVVAIAAGTSHSLALKRDGTVVTWGASLSAVPEALSGVTAIAAGGSHSLALKADGTVVAWGYNHYGQTTIPVGLNAVVAIAAGYNHSLALKADGSIVAWGSNSEGQTSVPAGLSGIVSIAAGYAHSLAMKADGSIVVWGSNSKGQAALPAGLIGVGAIAAGGSHSMTLQVPTGPPLITCTRLWTTEAAGARPGNVLFYQRICAPNAAASYTAVGLPPGLVLDPATGIISGAATAIGTFPLTLSATNPSGTATADVTLTVTGAPRLVQPLPTMLPGGGQIFAVGSVALDGLPAGASFNSATGEIMGLPLGFHSVSVTIANTYGTVTIPWTVEVPPVFAWGANSYGQSTVPPGLSGIAAIAGGESNSLALKADGSVVAWGRNFYGQSTVPAGLSGVVAISTGRDHSQALKSDGSIVAWGSLGVPEGLSGIVAIASGDNHSLALKADGSVIAWGDSSYGQTTVPAGMGGVVAIAAGSDFSLALKSDGTVVAWGGNYHGQSNVPAGLSGVVAITSAGYNSLALKADGSLVSWGYENSDPPPELQGVVAIARGSDHSVALKADGSVVVWGAYPFYQIALPAGLNEVVAIAAGKYHTLALKASPGPPMITCARRWITEAVGARAGDVKFYQRISTCGSPTSYTATGLPPGLVLDPDSGIITGAATAVGTFPVTLNATNSSGSATADVVLTVTGVPRLTQPLSAKVQNGTAQIFAVGNITLTEMPSVAAFDPATGILTNLPPGNLTLGVTVSNPFGTLTVPWTFEVPSIFAWGADYFGQVTVPSGLGDVSAVAAGGDHSLALKPNGTVVAWGRNHEGQTSIPAGLSGVVAIAAGDRHSLALKANGTVVAWGSNTSGQIALPSGLTNVVAIAAGGKSSLALKTDGSVIAWGNSAYNQKSLPGGLSGVVGIAVGDAHSLALREDGAVISWGYNPEEQNTVVPGALSGVASIAAGSNHSMARKANGSVLAWGSNTEGQTTVPVGLSGCLNLAAGRSHSLALKADGSVIAWGYNYYGQSTVPSALSNGGGRAIAAGSYHSLALKSGGPVAPITINSFIDSPYSRTAPTPTVAIPRYAATNLPPGIYINEINGAITGTFVQAGVWQTVIREFNRATSNTQTLTFIVPTLYDAWRAGFWPAGGPDSTSEADPDGDGVSNLMEYVLATSPTVPSPPATTTASRTVDGAMVIEMDVADQVALWYWEGEFSADLDFKYPSIAYPTEVPGAAHGFTRLRFVDPAGSSDARRMGRLRVTLP